MSNRKILVMLQKVIAFKRQQLSELPRADTSELKQQKQGRRFAISAISRAIEEISALDWKIKDGKSAMQIPAVGKGIASRIDELLETGTLAELQSFKPDKDLSELQAVFGIGPALAKKLGNSGISTVPQLRLAVTSGHVKVADPVIQGILNYKDLLTRIPREEMLYYNRLLLAMAKTLGPSVRLDLLGSFRRKTPDCGDLDVLVSSTQVSPENLLHKFLQGLEKKRMLVSYLSEGPTKFAGIINHPKIGIARRLDVRYVQPEDYAPALFYFTGSASFNVEMRRIAIRKGLKLSEYGLLKKNNQKIPVTTEQDIFDALDVPYVPPEKR